MFGFCSARVRLFALGVVPVGGRTGLSFSVECVHLWAVWACFVFVSGFLAANRILH